MNKQCSVPEAHFRLLFEAAPSPLLVLLPDAGFTIVAASDEYLKQTLTRREEIIGRRLFDVFPDNPDVPSAGATSNLGASLARVVASRKPDTMAVQRYDVPRPDKSGFDLRYWSPLNVPVLDRDGSLLYILHRVDNVTAYMESLEANEVLRKDSDLLREEVFQSALELSASNSQLKKMTEDAIGWRAGEAKFRTITDALPQMVWTALPNGSMDYLNRQFDEFAGVPHEVVTGGDWLSLLHPDDRERAGTTWAHSVATGEPYEVSYRLRDRFGEYSWTLARGLALRDDNGAIIKWVGTNTDIHEKVLAQDELREAARRKDEFLAMLAHELRNPLAPISAAAEMLCMTHKDDAQIRQVSGIIRRQVSHVTSLVEDLLDVSRVTRGQIKLDRNILGVREVVRDAAEQAGPLIQERQHHLSLHLAAGDICVCGDHKRLVQVLTNVLNNAAKYTPVGGEISLSVDASPDDVFFSVRDNGIGMTPELLEKVFDLFEQGERTADRAQGGLGIGLALVMSLVEQHHGTVAASSKGPGQGSEVTIRLPRVLPTNSTAAHAQTPADAGPKGLRILLVDDNVDAGQTTGMLLELLGNDVVVEYSAESALERTRHEHFDAYILDIGLPGMDGYELARRIRKQPTTDGGVFAALTGYGQEQDRQVSKSEGFAYHFVKPVGMRDLEQLSADVARR